jgi:hypothetical protein
VDIFFTINRYDRDGDLIDNGIFLHFDETIIKVAETIEEYDKVINHVISIKKEIIEEGHLEELNG